MKKNDLPPELSNIGKKAGVFSVEERETASERQAIFEVSEAISGPVEPAETISVNLPQELVARGIQKAIVAEVTKMSDRVFYVMVAVTTKS